MQYVLQAPNVWHGFLNQVGPSAIAVLQGNAGPTMITEYNNDKDGGEFVASVGASQQSAMVGSQRGNRREMSMVQGALGKGFDGTDSRAANAVKGKKEVERLVGEGHLMNEATIREMSTMTFA